MGFLENISKGISDFGQTTIQKGKDVANVAKFSRMISDEEKSMSKAFEQLGRKYFDLCGVAPSEEFAEFITSIRESQEKIYSYQEAIKELQGITKCQQCGADVPNGAKFCPECGAPAVIKEEPEEEQDAMKPVRKYCSECGAVILPDSRFCTNCGKKIELEETVEEAPEKQEPIE